MSVPKTKKIPYARFGVCEYLGLVMLFVLGFWFIGCASINGGRSIPGDQIEARFGAVPAAEPDRAAPLQLADHDAVGVPLAGCAEESIAREAPRVAWKQPGAVANSLATAGAS